MAIIINDTNLVKSKAEELKTESVDLKSVKESIEYILNELNGYWSATQEDQQVFYKGLQEDVESLDTISACNTEFAEAMKEYIDSGKKSYPIEDLWKELDI